ncbi:MAG: HlyD family efflux transporter periplasmic adaptor subunit [Betaproteobacteria bacterium]|nr:MAG: HlyD family efflux transporter periplasmic adaptor subunit [Betaproteobacteria bacterium]
MSESPAKSSLYRPEALAYQRERAWGELLIFTPRPARCLAWLAVLLALTFVAFLALAEYTRKARAPATLTYATDAIIVAATEPGTLIALNVKAGETVKRGQLIGTVSTERLLAGESVFASGARDDAARRAAIEAERREAQSQLTAQLTQNAARIRAIEAEALQADREIAAQRDRIAQLRSQLERFKALAASKFVSDLQVQQKQDDVAEQLVKLESLNRSRATLERDAANARAELPTLRAAAQSRIATLNRDETSLAQATREGLSRRAYDVVAASDGVIERNIATVGQTVGNATPILQMRSGARDLVADVYVPTRSAGFLRVGQSVRIAVDAFPFERFGHVDAQIVDIGRTVLAPSDVANSLQLKEPAFRVRAALSRQSIDAYGTQYPLRSGLAAQADITLDQRALYRWVIEPILRLRGQL